MMPEMTDFNAICCKSVNIKQSKQAFFVRCITKNDQVAKKIMVNALFGEK